MIFPLMYPGTILHWDLPREARPQADSLLRLLELHLADAAVGLDLFDQACSNPVRLTSHCFEGHIGVEGYYQLRAPHVHAHTVLYALDGIGKALGKLAGICGLPAGVAAARDAYAAALPSLIPLRNSALHREDRALELDHRKKPLSLQPVAGRFIRYDAGALVLSALTHNMLGYTLDDGTYGEIEISAATVAHAQAAIQQVLDSLPWIEPPRMIPPGWPYATTAGETSPPPR